MKISLMYKIILEMQMWIDSSYFTQGLTGKSESQIA